MQDPDEGPGGFVNDPNNAFAPFSEEFDAGPNVGQSCEAFAMDIYDNEESYVEFVSPSSGDPGKMCHEVNLVVFDERYENLGLASSFALTVPQNVMPVHWDPATNLAAPATYGWAKLSFTGEGTNEGLSAPKSRKNRVTLAIDSEWDMPQYDPEIKARRYTGLPVDGFMMSIYDSGDPASGQNHTMINEHKYETSFYKPHYKRPKSHDGDGQSD